MRSSFWQRWRRPRKLPRCRHRSNELARPCQCRLRRPAGRHTAVPGAQQTREAQRSASAASHAIEMRVPRPARGPANPLAVLPSERDVERVASEVAPAPDQLAELSAIRMLADPRFTPHLSAEEFSEAVRAVLSEHQAERLTTSLWRHRAR